MTQPDPLRILHITPYYAPAWAYGGSPRVAYELATRLAARGHAVTVLTTDAHDASGRAEPGVHTIDGVTVHRVRNLSNRLAWRRVFLPVGFRQVARRLIPGADVVHVHEARSLLNAAALPVLRRSAPYVVMPHGGLPAGLGRAPLKRVYDALWGRRLLDGACRLHALTDMERDPYFALGMSPRRVVLIPNGIDAAAFDLDADPAGFRARYDIPVDAPVVGYLGRLNEIKGLDGLVDAFALVLADHPSTILLLVGPDDGARAALVAQIALLGISHAVRFTGMITGDLDKAAAYRAMDVYALPSRYENMPVGLLEALLNGTPGIVSDRCGLAARLGAADVARVTPYGDADALAGEINALLCNKASADALAGRGRDYVTAHFDWEAVVDRWEAVYRACAAGDTLSTRSVS
jgi:glycosyltransferase involved in cell wall biosynthesis